jgi:hypothetical protein
LQVGRDARQALDVALLKSFPGRHEGGILVHGEKRAAAA